MITPNKREELNLKSIITSGELKNIRLFQVNDTYFEFDNNDVMIIDGGIELVFPKGIISFSWSTKKEQFILTKNSFSSVYQEDNFIELFLKKTHKLKGLKVLNVEFKVSEFEFLVDYTMKTEKENNFSEIFIEFENNYTLQLALIAYETDANNDPTEVYNYNLSNEILISLNKRIDINTNL